MRNRVRFCRAQIASFHADESLLNEQDIASGKAFAERWLAENGYEAARRHRTKLKAADWGVDGFLNRILPSTPRFN